MSNQILNLFLYHPVIKKIANFFIDQPSITLNPLYLYFSQKHIFKIAHRFENKPFCVRIENTNYCNGRCSMCPHSKMKRPAGTMSRSLYQKIINQMSQLKINYLNLHNFGEPLIDSDFVWKVKYAKSMGIKKISTNTNGQLLKPALALKIVKSGLDEIFFSLDAFSPKTYRKIRIGLNYKTVISNLKNLIKIKKKLNSPTPKIIVDFLKTDLNQHEVKPFIAYWSKLVDHVCISQLHDWSEKSPNIKKFAYKNYVTKSQSPCRLPFTELLINWDGSVSLCCQDTDGEVLLGNAAKENIVDIWRNQKFQNIRRHHLQLNTDFLPLCQNCKLRTFWWTF